MKTEKTFLSEENGRAETAEGRQSDSPGVIALPPLLYVGALLLGLALHFLWPVHPLGRLPARVTGAALALAGGLFVIWGATTMRRAGTNVHPGKPSTLIVTHGPFRFTRNPLYLGNLVFYTGLTLLVDSLWPLLLLPVLIALLEWGVIRREERYLEAKFGETYLAYKSRVRRWL